MKKTARKVLLMACSALLLVCLTVGATVAYLTAEDKVENTFTVGKVAIRLDEAKVDSNGKATNDPRVKKNDYHLLPGLTYDKDPMVTVLANSEKSYVRMFVTVSKSAELDKIFASSEALLTEIFVGYDAETWIYKGNKENTTENTRTYEFWYNGVVAKAATDTALDPIFTQIKVPDDITNAQLESISGLTITAVAHAIQADGFANPEAAWEEF